MFAAALLVATATSVLACAAAAPPTAVTAPTAAAGHSLPDGNLIVGYAPHCNETQIVGAAAAGVNVIIWFSVNLAAGPAIQNQLDFECIARVAHTLRERDLPTAHLISIGGWDAPHPDTSLTGAQWFEVWQKWNAAAAASVPASLGWGGFDGIDWDLEGNDTPDSPWNHFTVACIDLMGTMSQAAKAAGYVVSLVPPQSYWDVTTGSFDLSLRHSYDDFHPEFLYRGDNCYAALLAKYGETPTKALAAQIGAAGHDTAPEASVPTFDMVMVQLYESYSRACQAINGVGVKASDYLAAFIKETLTGEWTVDFSSVPELGITGNRTLQLTPQQFVIGFSRGVGEGKSVFVWPREVGDAWARVTAADGGTASGQLAKPVLRAERASSGGLLPVQEQPGGVPNAAGRAPRGVMFWNINNDGGPVNGTTKTSSFSKEFNSFLHVRKQ